MSKYGFNKNEVRKIICDLIDKDGFHEEHVFYGDKIPQTFGTAQVGIVNNLEEQLPVSMVQIDASVGYELRFKIYQPLPIQAGGSALFNMIPLFNGKYTLNLAQFGNNIIPVIEGSAKAIPDGVEIYGDCTITLNTPITPITPITPN